MQAIEAMPGVIAPSAVIAEAPAAELPRDEIGDRLIAEGLAHNSFLLDLNHALTVPHDWTLPAPWNLPSRLFRFPIEVSATEANRRLVQMRAGVAA